MLIDTNVWGEILRPQPSTAVLDFLTEWRDETVLSTIVLAEMEYGIAKLDQGARRQQLRAFVDDIVVRHTDRLLMPNLAAATIFGMLKADLRSRGKPIADLDLMIAAQALSAGMPLATRNVLDMERTGVVIINPWDA